MKTRILVAALTCWLFGGVLTSAAAQRNAKPAAPQTSAPASADNQADAYFNFMMGHLYDGNYRSSSPTVVKSTPSAYMCATSRVTWIA